jgi:hypothetical protein
MLATEQVNADTSVSSFSGREKTLKDQAAHGISELADKAKASANKAEGIAKAAAHKVEDKAKEVANKVSSS